MIAVVLIGMLVLGIGVIAVWRARPVALPALPSSPDPAINDAVRAAADLVRGEPRSGDAWGQLGMVLLAHQMDAVAVEALARAEALAPADARWPYYAGVALRNESADRSRAKLAHAAQLAGDRYPAILLRAGETLTEAGEFDQAERLFERVRLAEPSNGRALAGLGQIAAARNEPAAARALLEAALRAGFDTKAVRGVLATVLRQLNEPDLAARQAAAAAALPDRFEPPDPLLAEVGRLQVGEAAWITRATALHDAGRLDEALKYARQVIQTYPDSARGYWTLGLVHQSRNEMGASDAALARARELRPDLTQVALLHSFTLMRMRQYAQAEAAARLVVQRLPNDGAGHFSLGLILYERRDYPGAVTALEKAAALRPGDPRVQEALTKARAAAAAG